MNRTAHLDRQLPGIVFRGAVLVSLALLSLSSRTRAEDSVVTGFPEYEMTVTIGTDSASMEITGQIVIPPTQAPRAEIVLGLSEKLGDLRIEMPEPAGTVLLPPSRGELIPGLQDGWGTYPYAIRFEDPWPAGRPLRLSFRCRGGEATAFVYHVGAPVIFASGINTAWYPQVDDPRVEDGGWSGLRATGTMTIELPEGLSVYAAGQSPPEAKQAIPFRFETPVFFSFAAGPYRMISAPDDPPVVACFLRARENQDEYVTGGAAVLNVLRSMFGPYPYSRFGIVEVPTADAQAAGFAGASLDGFILANTAFLDRRFNTAYFGHEIGHQWWGNLMTLSEERGGMMFSEAMAQYGSLVAVETIEGPAAAERYRRSGYPGYSAMQCGLGYLRVAAAGLDAPLPDANDGPAARIIADGKGFQVWNMLADEVGPDRFSSALREIIGAHALRPLTWEGFLAEIERATGADLGWFYAQWLERPGAPFPVLEWSQRDGEIAVTVVQDETPYRLTVDVEVTASTGERRIDRVEVDGRRTSVTLPAPWPVSTVELDPRYRILRWTPEFRAEATALATVTRAQLLAWDDQPQEAARALQAALDDTTMGASDDYGRRYALESMLGRVLFQDEKYDEARQHLETALRAPTRRVEDLPWTYYFLGRVALAQNDEDLLDEVRRSIAVADVRAGGTGAPEALREQVERR
ncbi:MAG: M1 family aminopeptidase [Candidatus Eisenbacteria bacterium]